LLLARLLRRLRGIEILRRIFFSFARDYRTLWNAFAIAPGLGREAILANAGDDEEEFWHSGERDAKRYILPFLSPDSSVLDLGTGIGRIARWVAPHCAHLTAVDVSDRMLQRARSVLGIERVSYVRSDGRTLTEIPTSSIDLAYSLLVFQHIEREDVVSYLDELRRVLRNEGGLVLQLPNLADKSSLEAFVNYALHGRTRSVARLRYYTREEVGILFNRFGFVVDEEQQRHGSMYLRARKRDSDSLS
jgi:ubiquinone/menaquinone biosynthesis C-methylase UbiE